MAVNAIPEGYHALTPYLIVQGATQAIQFYQKVFAAELVLQMNMPDGGVAHAELKIGNSHLMISDECPDMHFKGPNQLGGTPVTLMHYVEDVDMVFSQALAMGAKELRAVENQFYGDRAGTLEDPFGHIWTIATHIEDLSELELQERMSEYMSKQG
ncbi:MULTISPECIES: VOC family protein [Pseudoalteromonas]|uniref:VOC domain-containing protein n=2 Tax=Pseudoalteromonas TaxID=53246 RepID=V4HW75_PSEL2|nr:MULTISPECIES: VOC family protein [Pseudoalteromonas]ESP94033.1 hypothetical protein PL2TA16_02557 [Pseudoalteromonas luteoviolacea 2ta16]KZN33479.1 hypothetical protein N483_02380 [Pseudoalteromonas luteoviolacea NCIMB 1944]MBQ4838754.1 VOC family protein [Pseudoalteromonas luteoviolacea]MCG7548938.1 VOC family protein [Pseudoalteromonas sp. Of7M-16]MDK2596381.1 VOC family protein [Pseudoalteromonas sp. P94(2023)]